MFMTSARCRSAMPARFNGYRLIVVPAIKFPLIDKNYYAYLGKEREEGIRQPLPSRSN